jgi:prepilin-type N-terminal cleavage/methylation domain-containing protein
VTLSRLNRPSRRRRALTLLEVLLATALLAMLAAACVPAIARAMTMLRDDSRREQREFHLADLETVADAFLEKTSRFGVLDVQPYEIDVVEFEWPADSGIASTSPIVARARRSADAEVTHLWLLFECEGLTVSRWVAIPVERDTTPGGSP